MVYLDARLWVSAARPLVTGSLIFRAPWGVTPTVRAISSGVRGGAASSGPDASMALLLRHDDAAAQQAKAIAGDLRGFRESRQRGCPFGPNSTTPVWPSLLLRRRGPVSRDCWSSSYSLAPLVRASFCWRIGKQAPSALMRASQVCTQKPPEGAPVALTRAPQSILTLPPITRPWPTNGRPGSVSGQPDVRLIRNVLGL
jgi:hypothetical protein